jgi:hypothetical protein
VGDAARSPVVMSTDHSATRSTLKQAPAGSEEVGVAASGAYGRRFGERIKQGPSLLGEGPCV